jgi:hypothetical protein
MAAPDTLIQLLREGTQPARMLYERLDVSQPTLSRMVVQLGESILRFGKARQTQYALRRKIGSHEKFPLFRVSTTGNLEQWGILHPVMPEAYLVETLASDVVEPRMDFHQGLPWFLQDMRPQGFLGRAFARFHGPLLGLPADPTRWNDDQALLALANTGHDCPGNLLVGEEAASIFQTGVFFAAADRTLSPVPDDQRLQKYPEFARLALAGEVVGSSAGGEQPKFNIEILHDDQPIHVMVKFSAPQDNDATRRWRSLLICEYLAFQVLGEVVPTSRSQLLDVEIGGAAHQLFLEVARFDRIGDRGRRGVVSLKALDDEFAGLAADWPKVAAALVQSGHLNESVYLQVQKLYAFGVLIGNSDMHPGNLSFFVNDVTKSVPEFALAPVYDMLPMSLAPRPSGQIPDTLPMPKIGINPPLEIWREILPMACNFWLQVASHTGVADDVRQMAQNQSDILSRPLNLI